MDCIPLGSSVLGILQARVLECVAISFSRGSSQPRDRTQVYHVAGKFFTVLATREVSNTSPLDLPDPGIEPKSLTLQADCLPAKLSGKP